MRYIVALLGALVLGSVLYGAVVKATPLGFAVILAVVLALVVAPRRKRGNDEKEAPDAKGPGGAT